MTTLQTIFDRVAEHLLVQNKRSQNPLNGVCLYRSDAGDMCAVGCLIKDDFYNFNMEQKSVYSPVVIEAIHHSLTADDPDFDLFPYKHDDLEPYFTNTGSGATVVRSDAFPALSLLSDLQGVHDEEDPEVWMISLVQIAKDHNLSPNILSEYGADLT